VKFHKSAWGFNVPARRRLDAKTKKLVEEISAIPGGEAIRLCIQYGTCTASCPNAARMEYTPSEIIALARAGMRHEVLSSHSMWHRLSCYLCTVRCPRGIKPTELMHTLETIAPKEGLSPRRALTHSRETIEKCRVGWGQVKSLDNGHLTVEHRPLVLEQGKLKLGELATKKVLRQIAHTGFGRDCQAGDWVSIHWDWACAKLTPAQVQNLDKYTRYHLTLANQTR